MVYNIHPTKNISCDKVKEMEAEKISSCKNKSEEVFYATIKKSRIRQVLIKCRYPCKTSIEEHKPC